jgi:heme oxygenase (biliverdin-IX-beta and delta-forming)
MNPRQRATLRELLQVQTIAALGTLHDAAPFVSMVPIALLPHASGIVINVSELASHTADMLADPRVSLLIVAPQAEGAMAQSLARVTIQGTAMQLMDGSAGHAAARDAYLARFPDAAQIAALPDFSFFSIRPESARFIPGFAQAMTLATDEIAKALGP